MGKVTNLTGLCSGITLLAGTFVVGEANKDIGGDRFGVYFGFKADGCKYEISLCVGSREESGSSGSKPYGGDGPGGLGLICCWLFCGRSSGLSG